MKCYCICFDGGPMDNRRYWQWSKKPPRDVKSFVLWRGIRAVRVDTYRLASSEQLLEGYTRYVYNHCT